MALDPRLLEILTCPCEKHAPVEYKDRRKVVVCTECALQFPVRDGIPIMLLDEATQGSRPRSSS